MPTVPMKMISSSTASSATPVVTREIPMGLTGEECGWTTAVGLNSEFVAVRDVMTIGVDMKLSGSGQSWNVSDSNLSANGSSRPRDSVSSALRGLNLVRISARLTSVVAAVRMSDFRVG